MRLRLPPSFFCLGLVLISGIACADGPPDPQVAESASPKNSPTDQRARILFIGTSLTAGYGLDPSRAWTTLVQKRIDEAGLQFEVVNAGVSGETSAGALRRLDWLLSSEGTPAVVMVETGANDGLRGLNLDELRSNLDAILTRLDRLSPRPEIILAGMEALPNMGREYTSKFRSIYPSLARQHHAVFLPFFLDGVAGNARYNQADGIHPNPEGSRIVADNVWTVLRPLLEE